MGVARGGAVPYCRDMPPPAPIPFEVQLADEGPDARLALCGELDMATAPLLARHLESAARRGPSKIVLDLAALRFVDVSGLRAILDAARSARREGSAIVVVNPLPHIVRLLEITAIDQSLVVQGRPLSAVAG